MLTHSLTANALLSMRISQPPGSRQNEMRIGLSSWINQSFSLFPPKIKNNMKRNRQKKEKARLVDRDRFCTGVSDLAVVVVVVAAAAASWDSRGVRNRWMSGEVWLCFLALVVV